MNPVSRVTAGSNTRNGSPPSGANMASFQCGSVDVSLYHAASFPSFRGYRRVSAHAPVSRTGKPPAIGTFQMFHSPFDRRDGYTNVIPTRRYRGQLPPRRPP